MSNKEENIADDIVQIFVGLPEIKKQRLLGVAEGMKISNEIHRKAQEEQGHTTRI